MGKLGTRWNISGIPAAFITPGTTNGRYRITFERESASLEQIEGIDWTKPVIQQEDRAAGAFGLPEGYGFEIVDLQYQHASRCFILELRIAEQYLGDVTGYQAEIAELTQLAVARAATIQEQAAAIRAQKDWEHSLQAAYQEGVESNG